MALPETFEAIRPSVVAFISRIGFAVSGEEPPIFPHIIGTGFFVHEKGIVATNRHVIEAIEKVNEAYSPDLLNGHSPIGALVFTKINAIGTIWEIGVLNVDVMGWNSLNGFSSDGACQRL